MIPLDDAPAAGGRRAAVPEREKAVIASLRSLGTALDGEPGPAFRTATRTRLVAMAAVRTPEPAPAPRSLLSRVRRAVDRRFDRTRYDAEVTVQLFGTRVRDEVDPAGVVRDLVDATHATVQPVRVAVWVSGGLR